MALGIANCIKCRITVCTNMREGLYFLELYHIYIVSRLKGLHHTHTHVYTHTHTASQMRKKSKT